MAKTWEDLRKKLLAVPGAKEALNHPEYLKYTAEIRRLMQEQAGGTESPTLAPQARAPVNTYQLLLYGRWRRVAWIDGKWLGRADRQKRIDALADVLEAAADGVDVGYEADELLALLDELDKLKRVHRAEVDQLFFNYEYFGEDANPGNPGNWIPAGAVAPPFHHELCDILNTISNDELNKKLAAAAPRSHAKSSYLSKGKPTHEIVFRKRKYIIIISETPSVSKANIEWISMQLKYNDKLRDDFGPLLHEKGQLNPRDNSEEFIAWETLDNCRQRQLTLVQAASSGQALRGRNWNGNRPDLIICDDVDSEKNNNTEQLRTELKEWFRKVVIPLGDPEGKKTAIVFMGTTVHAESLLIEIMKNRGDFEAIKYKALITPPKRADLWEECRKLYQNREDKDSARNAELFYVAHKAEMDEGAEVLWPDVQPLYKLMAWKWDNGSKAFSTEYQNEPIDSESAIFDLDAYQYWDTDGKRLDDFKSRQYEVFMGVDMAFGKKKGDYSAIAVIAKHKETALEYVVESWGARLGIDQFMTKIIAVADEWQPDGIAAEAVQGQDYIVDQLKERMFREIGYPPSRIDKYLPRGDKLLRIEAMEPDLAVGKLVLARRHSLLLEQMERFGSNAHDDLPDAVHIARTLTKKRRARVLDKPRAF